MKTRVTLNLDEEVVEQYKSLMASMRGTSLSKFINDWLTNTAPAAEHMVKQIELAHREPEMALNELVLFQEQMRQQVVEVNDQISALRQAVAKESGTDSAPHTNRGLNLPPQRKSGGSE